MITHRVNTVNCDRVVRFAVAHQSARTPTEAARPLRPEAGVCHHSEDRPKGAVVDEVALPDLPAVNFDWDPETWEKAAQRAVELAVDVSTGWAHGRPGPEDPPDRIRERFRDPLPRAPVPFDAIGDRLEELASLSTFIGHPRWFAYITSSPNPTGVVGDFVTSAINPNIGLWRGGPAATAVEVQSIDWLKELVGDPPQAEGVYTSGGQFANIVAHAVIRDHAAGWDVRRRGMNPGGGAPNLRVYASEEIHYCHQQAAELQMGR